MDNIRIIDLGCEDRVIIFSHGNKNMGVTNVGLSASPIFSVGGSPVTTAGTLTLNFVNEAPNMVFAGPVSGGTATPTFRSLNAADMPQFFPYTVYSALYNNGMVDGYACTINDKDGNLCINVDSKQLIANGLLSVDWVSRLLNDDASRITIDWRQHQLFDTYGNVMLDFSSQLSIPVATAGGSYGTNEQTMLQTVYNALRTLGLGA